MSRLLLYRVKPRPRIPQLCCICDKYRIKDTHLFEFEEIDESCENYDLIICQACRLMIPNIIKNINRNGVLSREIIFLVGYCCRLDLIDLLLQIINNYPYKMDPSTPSSDIFVEDINMPNGMSRYTYNIRQHFAQNILSYAPINILKALCNNIFCNYAAKFLSYIVLTMLVNSATGYISIKDSIILGTFRCSDKCLKHYTKETDRKTYYLLRNIVGKV